MTIRLEGNKVVLRDITMRDVESIYHWTYLAEDREHLNWNSPYTEREDLSFDEFLEKKYSQKLDEVGTDSPRRVLVIETNGKMIGDVGRYWVSENTNWFEIGIVIYDSNFWSGGYGTEAFKMWMEYLFNNMDTIRLGIGTWSGNYRMIGLAKKMGMVEEARVRKARIVNGEYYDAIKMGILREEWEALYSNFK